MSEEKAWLYMANVWDSPIEYEYSTGVMCGHLFVLGLCAVIGNLYLYGRISRATYERMQAKMRRITSKRMKWGGYVWSRNRAGARCRARFCRKMAGECGRAK